MVKSMPFCGLTTTLNQQESNAIRRLDLKECLQIMEDMDANLQHGVHNNKDARDHNRSH